MPPESVTHPEMGFSRLTRLRQAGRRATTKDVPAATSHRVPPMSRFPAVASLLFAALPSFAAEVPAVGLRAPEGFVVTEFAGNELANDIVCMTIDARGRIFVAGRGYIRILVDDDGDGRADRAIEFADTPKTGAQGLLVEGDTLYAVGDGGLWRYRDADGDGKADGPPEKLVSLKTASDHHSHALLRGTDGWLYLLVGDSAGIDRSFASLPTSPVKEPNGGCVIRFPPDFKGSEVVAHGYRNPYGFDFNADGELFTYDSDNERCVSLPWIEGTRFYHVQEGGHHGWVSPQFGTTWRRPPYFADVVAPIADLGRGSPTGVAIYRHTAFPSRYTGGAFLADWTFGKIYFVPLARKGATYAGTPEMFIESVGGNGFAPTALCVHPASGDLYISIGGRGTRGAVYRVRPAKPTANATAIPVAKRSLEWRDELATQLIARATGDDDLERIRAIGAVVRFRDKFLGSQAMKVIEANLGHPDRRVRDATVPLIRSMDPANLRALVATLNKPLERLTLALAITDDAARKQFPRLDDFATERDLFADRSLTKEVRLGAIRAAQLGLGDLNPPERKLGDPDAVFGKGTVWEGYALRSVPPKYSFRLEKALAAAFPSGDADIDRELTRTLAALGSDDAKLPAAVAAKFTESSDPLDDVHYLIVMGRLKAFRTGSVTAATAAALVRLDAKIVARKRNRDRNWPLRMAEALAALAERDPALPGAILPLNEFGRPDHSLLAEMPWLRPRSRRGSVPGESQGRPRFRLERGTRRPAQGVARGANPPRAARTVGAWRVGGRDPAAAGPGTGRRGPCPLPRGAEVAATGADSPVRRRAGRAAAGRRPG
jgi:putative membrane-bound dehydrogenase-like protein